MELPVRPSAMDERAAGFGGGSGPAVSRLRRAADRAGLRSAQVLLTSFDMSRRTALPERAADAAAAAGVGRRARHQRERTTTTDEISFGDTLPGRSGGDPAAGESCCCSPTRTGSSRGSTSCRRRGADRRGVGVRGARRADRSVELTDRVGACARRWWLRNGHGRPGSRRDRQRHATEVVAAAFAGEDAGTRSCRSRDGSPASSCG